MAFGGLRLFWSMNRFCDGVRPGGTGRARDAMYGRVSEMNCLWVIVICVSWCADIPAIAAIMRICTGENTFFRSSISTGASLPATASLRHFAAAFHLSFGKDGDL